MAKTLYNLLAAGAKLTNQDGNDIDPEEVGVEVETEVEQTEGGEDIGAEGDFGVDTDTDVDGDGDVDAADSALETELLDVEDTQDQIDETEEGIEDGEDVALDLQNFYQNLELAASMQGGAISTVHADLALQHLNSMEKRLGLPVDTFVGSSLSVQSFSGRTDAVMATQNIKERAKNAITKVLDMILKAIAASVRFVKDLITKVFNNVDKLITKANQLKENAASVKGVEAKDKTFKSAGGALDLRVNNKTIGVVEASALLKEVVETCNSDWAPAKLGMVGVNIADKLAKSAAEDAFLSNANDFATKYSSLKQSLPFTSKGLSAAEAKDLGISLKDGEEAFTSARLPRDKAVVVILPKDSSDQLGRLSIRLAGVKASKSDESRSIDLPVLSDAEIGTGISNIISALQAMKSLKKKIEGSAQQKKQIERGITKARAQYLNVAAMKRDGVKNNTSNVGDVISILKQMVMVIDQPGASLSGYVLVEANGLLSIISKSVSAKASAKKKAEKADK